MSDNGQEKAPKKRKRGRPSAAVREGADELAQFIRVSEEGKTTRTQASRFYEASAMVKLSEAASEIPYLDEILFYIDSDGNPHGKKTKRTLIEQIGRMIEQDYCSDELVIAVARIAATAYHEGCTVKQIIAYIQNGRNTGEW